ncbi:LLM class flavin-dependent oxidoreductase [Zavarzinia compransoris]|uniref:Luciferase-like monooxygenase n=1 Tax=Zavarzinia compransoris TaxID=1264899 RepID=A0A317DYT1_9PROT|nr:LLM class flavin-dependent oxidoreductase [Zavarzinia compransoris]PWR18025.1 LLM class flavin-dependent oxidoreductase [Zavarzinia compransoris]TDP43509.1 luciferase family oxidoreductase group 1 [Zavarzinia compransoris]
MAPVFSILDQSPIRAGGTPAQAVAETVELAKLGDRLGYHRFWCAEHHASAAFAGSAPEVLISHLAAVTRRIRVGSGGVMLSHYAPLKVAEAFRMLETLYPGRIDLGLGRAPGGDHVAAAALRVGPQAYGPEVFPELLVDLCGFLRGSLAAGHPFARVRAQPQGQGMPDLWLLGSGGDSAAYAGALGAGFAYAHFINPDNLRSALEAYRRSFRPGLNDRPRVMLAVFALAADSAAEARHLARTRDLWVLNLLAGRDIPFPDPDSFDPAALPEEARRRLDLMAARGIAGPGDEVRTRLHEMAETAGAEEVMVVTITHDFAARCRSYELLAPPA